jgi:hypothetical protein
VGSVCVLSVGRRRTTPRRLWHVALSTSETAKPPTNLGQPSDAREGRERHLPATPHVPRLESTPGLCVPIPSLVELQDRRDQARAPAPARRHARCTRSSSATRSSGSARGCRRLPPCSRRPRKTCSRSTPSPPSTGRSCARPTRSSASTARSAAAPTSSASSPTTAH